MSIALESNSSNRIQRSGFVHGLSCIAIYDSPDSGRFSGDRTFPDPAALTTKDAVEERDVEVDSCSSSSIGRNSDASEGLSDGDGEVQSSCKGPLDTIDALEDVLPIKKGISKFYRGKSKSFTSLADAASCSSIKDIAKPENAYTRKRKNLCACNTFWDKSRNHPLRSGSGGMSKRPANSRSTLALALTMSSSSESNNNSQSSNSNLSPPSLRLPPLPPHSRRSPNNELVSPPRRNFSPWRSFSLSDLQSAAAAATPRITGLVFNSGEEELH